MTYVYANKNYTCKNRMGHVVTKFKIRNTIHVQFFFKKDTNMQHELHPDSRL